MSNSEADGDAGDARLVAGARVKIDSSRPVVNDLGFIQGFAQDGAVIVLEDGATRVSHFPPDEVSAIEPGPSELQIGVIAAAITAAEKVIADREASGAVLGVPRSAAVARVVAYALALFDVEHGAVWNRDEWTAAAQAAIEDIEGGRTAAWLVPMIWPEEPGPGIHGAD